MSRFSRHIVVPALCAAVLLSGSHAPATAAPTVAAPFQRWWIPLTGACNDQPGDGLVLQPSMRTYAVQPRAQFNRNGASGNAQFESGSGLFATTNNIVGQGGTINLYGTFDGYDTARGPVVLSGSTQALRNIDGTLVCRLLRNRQAQTLSYRIRPNSRIVLYSLPRR